MAKPGREPGHPTPLLLPAQNALQATIPMACGCMNAINAKARFPAAHLQKHGAAGYRVGQKGVGRVRAAVPGGARSAVRMDVFRKGFPKQAAVYTELFPNYILMGWVAGAMPTFPLQTVLGDSCIATKKATTAKTHLPLLAKDSIFSF